VGLLHVVANSVLLGLALKPSCTACFVAPAKIDEKAEKQNNRAKKPKSRSKKAAVQRRGERNPPKKMALEKKGFNMFQQRMTNNENMYCGNKRRGHTYIIKLGYTRMQTYARKEVRKHTKKGQQKQKGKKT
jgi:hypothetical protein